MEDWTEVIITVDAENADAAADIAQMVVPYGIYMEDYSNLEAEAMEIAHIDLIDEDLLAKDREHAWIHVYISPEENPQEAVAFLQERYNAAGIWNEIALDRCVKEDWINNWKKYFKPIPVGEKLLIRPIWEEAEDVEGRVVLDLEPGLAFGTGTHETTRLCMELLEKYTKGGETVLDVGCGSGILSVAAILLGAKDAVGVDIDPLAVKTAEENAQRNHVEDRFVGICGDLTDKVTGTYDIIVANIVADVICILTKDVKNFMKPHTVYLMSGIIDTREADVQAALAAAGFTVTDRFEEKGWVALAAKISE